MSNNSRNLVYLIFIYTCVEGLIINIMYPNTLAFVFKDMMIAVLYLALVTEQRGASGTLSKFRAPIVSFFLCTLLYMALPTPVTLMGEAVAVKQKLFYIPLMYCGYHFMRDERDLKTLLKIMALSSIPVSLFGIYLFFTGVSGLSSLGANYSTVVYSTAGEAGQAYWRVPSTFTSPGQFGLYLQAQLVMFTGTLFVPSLPRSQKNLTIVAMACAMVALMVSGSRSPILATFMCGALILLWMGKISGFGTWAVGLYSVISIAFVFLGDGVKDRVTSIASLEHVERLQDTYFGQLFLSSLAKYPMGLGMGVATMGARHFTNWADLILVESYLGVISTEMGVFGFMLFSWILVMVVYYMADCRYRMRASPLRALWCASAVFVVYLAALTPINSALDSAPGNMYFWFFIGLAARLYDDEQKRLKQLGQPAGAPTFRQPAGPQLFGAARQYT